MEYYTYTKGKLTAWIGKSNIPEADFFFHYSYTDNGRPKGYTYSYLGNHGEVICTYDSSGRLTQYKKVVDGETANDIRYTYFEKSEQPHTLSIYTSPDAGITPYQQIIFSRTGNILEYNVYSNAFENLSYQYSYTYADDLLTEIEYCTAQDGACKTILYHYEYY